MSLFPQRHERPKRVKHVPIKFEDSWLGRISKSNPQPYKRKLNKGELMTTYGYPVSTNPIGDIFSGFNRLTKRFHNFLSRYIPSAPVGMGSSMYIGYPQPYGSNVGKKQAQGKSVQATRNQVNLNNNNVKLNTVGVSKNTRSTNNAKVWATRQNKANLVSRKIARKPIEQKDEYIPLGRVGEIVPFQMPNIAPELNTDALRIPINDVIHDNGIPEQVDANYDLDENQPKHHQYKPGYYKGMSPWDYYQDYTSKYQFK